MEGLVGEHERLWPVPETLFHALMKDLGSQQLEHVHMVALDGAGRFLGESVLPGGENFLRARFRSIFSAAFDFGAVGLILSHNHPSGKAFPSEMDLVATNNIAALARPLDIEIVDHLIVTAAEVYSIRHLRVECRRAAAL